MRFAKTLGVSAASLVCVGSLAACGNSKSSTPTATPTASGSSSTAATASPPAAAASGNLSAVQECLKAAGITLPSAPAGGSFPAGGSPPPAGARPTGGFPSGAIPSGGPGGAFNNPQAQEALKACGITVPSAAPTS